MNNQNKTNKLNPFSFFFRRDRKVNTKNQINSGEIWKFDSSDGSPWLAYKDSHTVKILDVKNGWVRYKINSIFPDERMHKDTFLTLYYKIK